MTAQGASPVPDSIGFVGDAYLVLLLLVVPLLAWRLKRKLDTEAHVRGHAARFRSMLVQLSVLLVLTALTMWIEDVPVPSSWPAAKGWGAAGLICLVPLSFLIRRAQAVARPGSPARLLAFAPTSRADLPMWFLVCALAGIAEELAWRGVLPGLLGRHGLESEGALVVSCIAFGLAHLRYGASGVVMTTILGALLQMIVSSGDSLYPAMFLHALFNACVGIAVVRRVARGDIVLAAFSGPDAVQAP